MNLNQPNFNIARYRKSQKNVLLEIKICNATKILPHKSMSLTFHLNNILYRKHGASIPKLSSNWDLRARNFKKLFKTFLDIHVSLSAELI